MILTAIYHVLLTGELWNPTDLKKSDNFAAEREETIIKRAIKLLEKQGYAVQPLAHVP